MKNKEFFKISRAIEVYHSVFYKLWELGSPVFSNEIQTAAVSFDKDGKVQSFIFNPNFWEECSFFERCFVIMHECLHVIFNHGERLRNANRKLANIAMDVAIHESMTFNFGIDLNKVSFINDLCTIASVFHRNGINVERNSSAEYYLEQLIKNQDKMDMSGLQTPDSHEPYFGVNTEKEIEKILDTMDKEDGQLLDGIVNKEAGKTGGDKVFTLKIKTKPKRKWETIIKKWSLKHKNSFREIEQWAYPSRRHSMLPKKVKIPNNNDDERKEKDKIEVFFFQDTSGSCLNLKDRFFKAAKSLPKDRFNVRMFCFDTKVYETSLEEGKLYGFGGTSFNVIEDKIQEIVKNTNAKYPNAVFVITDGYGDNVNPERPKNWYWFLSTEYTNCIPKESNIFNLKDFE